MKKILYVVDTFTILGGIERVLGDKLNWLAQHGFRIALMTVNQGGHAVAFPLCEDIDICHADILFHRKYQYPLWRRALKERSMQRNFRKALEQKIGAYSPDVIVLTRTAYVKTVLRVCGDIPVVFESHNSCLYYQFEQLGMVERLRYLYRYHQMKSVAAVVSLTKGDAAVWRRWTPNVVTIPNVVNLNTTGCYSDCSAKSVIFIGRYSRQKDIHSLMKIWQMVHRRHPDWTLNLFGDYGDQRDQLMPDLTKMGAGVVIHEPTQAIGVQYLQNSMLLLTSLYEPFGLVMPEAMSYGLPVVAFDCPYGPAVIINDGVDGFLIKDRNVEDFADKVCRLIDDEPLRRTMGQAGIKSAQRFAADEIMPRWKNLLETLYNNVKKCEKVMRSI